MENLSRAIGFSLFFCFFAFLPQSADAQPVVINEIAWMGTLSSANDEWVELYNNTGNSINLDGWQLVSQDGTPKIKLSGLIPANGFYLLERTDDDTVPKISADKIYTGALGNNGENLELYDASGNLTDFVNCASGWFAGENETKQTMERTDSEWQTSQNPEGTPKTKNSLVVQGDEAIASSSPFANARLTELQPKAETDKPFLEAVEARIQETYPSGIIFNEILPSPEGPDDLEEWIEISNQNQFEVDLSGWKIKDSAGAVTTFTFPAGTKISASGFLVIDRPATKIVLNNDGDEIFLIQPDNKIVETISYSKAPLGQSYSRALAKASEWSWTNQLTPGAKNIIDETGSQIAKTEPSENTGEEKESTSSKKGLAAAGEQLTKSNFIIPLIALAVAAISAIIILILKKKLKKS